MEIRKCEHCDREFEVPNPQDPTPKRFCGKSCRRSWQRARTVGQRREQASEHCPTPKKLLWLDRHAAEGCARFYGTTVYQCDGGGYPHFHTTEHGLRLPGERLA